ncbi:MAG TPA: putative inorganic carbon transporter subunit DabA [Polyangiaceae bacterium]
MTDIAHLVDHVAHVLPAQGPIGVFIHHNTLHAWEDQRFEDAVVRAARRLGCQPFLPEDAYREELRRGRIGHRDVDAVLEEALAARADEAVVDGITRRELWRLLLLHGIPEARGARLSWLLSETDVLEGHTDLWEACLKAIGRSSHPPWSIAPPRRRHRDLLVATSDVDPDEWTRPVQIRFVGAYLDQGLARWPMPGRERGMYGCFLSFYGDSAARRCGAWAAGLVDLVVDDRRAGRDGAASLVRSLEDLGVPPTEWQEFLENEALWLRGWAGMVRQLETRPDRAPALAVPARLVDYLAVQLLLSRAALRHAMGLARIEGPLSQLRTNLQAHEPAPAPPPATERAWPVFHAAQLCGLSADRVAVLDAEKATVLETEVAQIDGLVRRRLLHVAFERRLRHRFYDALLQNVPRPPARRPAFQAMFCLDDREESFRRHLEEVEPDVETFGTAGFFGVAMYFRAAHAAHARPLCPVVLKPEHYVAEVGDAATSSPILRPVLAALRMTALVLRVLFPWLHRNVSRLQHALSGHAGARLRIDRAQGTPPLGKHVGFTVDEMADIVRGQLAPLGIAGRFARLVLVLGHGSTSLNNPQESAYDCGACGGGRGGPNGRAFAQMANDPRVRARLAGRGLPIPEDTWFVGGQRNSANNDVDLYDEDLVPDALRDDLERVRRTLEIARRRESHERCRRFESAPPSWFPEAASLLHVQARSADLAQPRPECGHATNAVCVIGRRSCTRGLFLDRRAFLVSYDATCDADGAALARLLAAVTPVLAGINLEYFFGFLDPTGYGCGTKLPHNVTGLLGVMDGAQSDLRTGLPWQMLEIHEPVRLTILVEATPEVLRRAVERDAYLGRLVRGRWLYLAALHPTERRLFEIDDAGEHPYAVEEPLPVVRGPSRTHYAGHAEHLPFVRIEPEVA